MNALLIPDSFKGSLTASAVAAAMEEGLRRHFPGSRCRIFAASDGGDGFLEAIGACRPLQAVEVGVSDPLGRPIQAPYLWDPERREAFVEMARASGLVLLAPAERNPLKAHTRGTGELLGAALEKGADTVYVGLGGSATNDGGIGLAVALGYRFLDAKGDALQPSGAALAAVARILPPEGAPCWEGKRIIAVNDVDNPLTGPRGAAVVYGPQKGADPESVAELDKGLGNLARVVARELDTGGNPMPGDGAAGGTAYGLRVFCRAAFVGGAEYMLRQSGAADWLEDEAADLILTGEGRLDEQSLQGKWIQAVLALGKRYSVPVVAVCGQCLLPAEKQREAGLAAVLEVSDPKKPLDWNMAHAYSRVREAVAGYFESL